MNIKSLKLMLRCEMIGIVKIMAKFELVKIAHDVSSYAVTKGIGVPFFIVSSIMF